MELYWKKGHRQTQAAQIKYRDAIAACMDEKYIEYTVSQIAQMFNLDGSLLGKQIRMHHPELITTRELERMKRGIKSKGRRWVRHLCKEQYTEAIEMLRTSKKSVKQVAQEHNIPFSELKNHLVQYHKDIVALRAERQYGQ